MLPLQAAHSPYCRPCPGPGLVWASQSQGTTGHGQALEAVYLFSPDTHSA